MTPPTIPPEAEKAATVEICGCGTCRERYEDWLRAVRAAYPHLRRAILAEVVPQIVAMARTGGRADSTMYHVERDWAFTPASILAALEHSQLNALETVIGDLRRDDAKWAETVERQRKAADRHREERAKLETEVAALRADARRWRAVRDDLCLDLMANPVQGEMRTFWRIDGNNYDYYREPVPATVDEAADMIAARSGGEGEANNGPR